MKRRNARIVQSFKKRRKIKRVSSVFTLTLVTASIYFVQPNLQSNTKDPFFSITTPVAAFDVKTLVVDREVTPTDTLYTLSPPLEKRSPRVATGKNQSLETPTALGESNKDAWNLILVNPWTHLPEGYSVTLTQLKNGQAVDERCYLDLQDMMDACRATGRSPVICSSYRTQEKQESLYNNNVNRLIAQGYTAEAAKVEAGKSVAVPGTSEHQLGLAVDIVDINNQNLDKTQESTEVQKWLMQHSWEFGFILRYPNGKSDITGIIYEPWHYRYVGKEAAKEIFQQGICLEEYLDT